MPLGWGRAIGSYVGSPFGSLGRPPGTKKGILQLYNNEHGLSSSTQLQNYNAIDDRKSIHTSIENANSEFDNQQIPSHLRCGKMYLLLHLKALILHKMD